MLTLVQPNQYLSPDSDGLKDLRKRLAAENGDVTRFCTPVTDPSLGLKTVEELTRESPGGLCTALVARAMPIPEDSIDEGSEAQDELGNLISRTSRAGLGLNVH